MLEKAGVMCAAITPILLGLLAARNRALANLTMGSRIASQRVAMTAKLVVVLLAITASKDTLTTRLD